MRGGRQGKRLQGDIAVKSILPDTLHGVGQCDFGHPFEIAESTTTDVRHAFLHHDTGYVVGTEITGVNRLRVEPRRVIKMRIIRHASRTGDAQLIDAFLALDVPFTI